jgi:tRNA(Ile)-lysidine synthetase-like protein
VSWSSENMLHYEQKVSFFIKRHQLIQSGDHLLVAVSGGPDSLSLLHYIWMHREKYSVQVAVAHVDHMLRGDESYRELQFVQQFCKERDIRFFSRRINIQEKMNVERMSLQETARLYRYKFFQEIMETGNYNKLVLGHHGDDQVETILMRLTRGSSSRGRAGIPVKRPFYHGEIIRPLLCLSKTEIEEYCSFYKLNPRRDPSNDKDSYTRNRFRHHLLPFLKQENERVHEHFQRFSEELREDEELLQELTIEKMNKIWKKDKGKVILSISPFLQLPPSLQRRGIHLILNYLYKETPSSLSSIHIDSFMQLLQSPHPSGKLDFPQGLKILRSYQQCIFQYEPFATQPFQLELNVGESVRLANGMEFSLNKKTNPLPEKNANVMYLHPDDVSLPLIIRSRQNGDKIVLKGTGGTKKVKDIFIDEKIPRYERDQWPIVTDQTGKILWIPGIKRSKFEAMNFESNSYYILHYKK